MLPSIIELFLFTHVCRRSWLCSTFSFLHTCNFAKCSLIQLLCGSGFSIRGELSDEWVLFWQENLFSCWSRGKILVEVVSPLRNEKDQIYTDKIGIQVYLKLIASSFSFLGEFYSFIHSHHTFSSSFLWTGWQSGRMLLLAMTGVITWTSQPSLSNIFSWHPPLMMIAVSIV